MTEENRLDRTAKSLITRDLTVYVHTRKPNTICMESDGLGDDQFIDVTLEQAQALREWLQRNVP